MRSATRMIAILGFLSSAFAASPFAGTWKFNATSSMSTAPIPPPKEEMLVIEEAGDQLRVALTGTAANGSPIVNKFSVAAVGGSATIQESPFDAISVRLIAPNIADLSYMRGGKELSTQHSLVSGDGKTLWLITRGATPQGGVVETVTAFDKR